MILYLILVPEEVIVDAANGTYCRAAQLKRCVDKLSKSTYPSLVPITVFIISSLQSVVY